MMEIGASCADAAGAQAAARQMKAARMLRMNGSLWKWALRGIGRWGVCGELTGAPGRRL
jgi:hypothetical protein